MLQRNKERLLRVDQAATRLNTSPRTVYRLAGEGVFNSCKIGGSLRIIESSLEKYIKKQIEKRYLEIGKA